MKLFADGGARGAAAVVAAAAGSTKE